MLQPSQRVAEKGFKLIFATLSYVCAYEQNPFGMKMVWKVFSESGKVRVALLELPEEEDDDVKKVGKSIFSFDPPVYWLLRWIASCCCCCRWGGSLYFCNRLPKKLEQKWPKNRFDNFFLGCQLFPRMVQKWTKIKTLEKIFFFRLFQIFRWNMHWNERKRIVCGLV